MFQHPKCLKQIKVEIDRIKEQVSEFVSELYGNCQLNGTYCQEEPLGPDLLEFSFLPLAMHHFRLDILQVVSVQFFNWL